MHVYQDQDKDVAHCIPIFQITQLPMQQIWRKEERTEDPKCIDKRHLLVLKINENLFRITRFPTWGRAWITVSNNALIPFAIFNNLRTRKNKYNIYWS